MSMPADDEWLALMDAAVAYQCTYESEDAVYDATCVSQAQERDWGGWAVFVDYSGYAVDVAVANANV